MDMNKGIDAQVSDRVDAYRGQPQQLMQMYQQNKELVDLLALQKLKSEKEAAKRQIEMQMQQQPGTVAQQREQEVMQMTKDELAKQTQGVLQRKQQQQQANMQRAAKGGIGALAQNRPAPAAPTTRPAPPQAPKPMMAGGGIVAFQPGGSVGGMRGLEGALSLEEQIAIIRRRTDLNEGQKQGLIEQLRAQQPRSEDRQFTTPVGRASSARMPGSPPNIPVGSETSALDVMAETNPRIAPPRVAPVAKEAPDLSGLGLGPETRPNNAPSGIEALTTGPTTRPNNAPAPATEAEAESTAATPAPAPAAATPTPTPTDTGIAALGAGSMGGAENALMRGVKIGEDVLGRDEKAAKYAEYEAQLAELDEELNDPEAERRQQLQAFLIGTAGATNIGYAMAGGAAASINLENQQKRNRRDRMLSRIQLGERGMDLDSEMGRAALSLGNQMFQDFNANKRAAISAGATLEAARLRKVTADANREFEREQQEDSNALQIRELDIREAENAVQQARNEELALGRRIDGVLNATKNLLQQSEDAYKMAADRYGLEGINADLSMLNPDDEGYDAARAKFETATAEADAWATQYLERLGVNDTIQDLEAQYYELTGVDAMPGLNPDDIVDVQTQGE